LNRTSYRVSLKRNLTAEGILTACCTTFQNATEFDVSLFYYSGHGLQGGQLLGCAADSLPVSTLRNTLDSIPGRKIVIIDACYSGAAADGVFKNEVAKTVNQMQNRIRKFAGLPEVKLEETSQEKTEDFNGAVISAFGTVNTARAKAACGSESGAESFSAYYVMTACAADEESWEYPFCSGGSSRVMGAFTYYLCRGCGWDGVSRIAVSRLADTNGDGVVTFGEAFSYAKAKASAGFNQQAQSNVGDIQTFSPFR